MHALADEDVHPTSDQPPLLEGKPRTVKAGASDDHVYGDAGRDTIDGEAATTYARTSWGAIRSAIARFRNDRERRVDPT